MITMIPSFLHLIVQLRKKSEGHFRRSRSLLMMIGILLLIVGCESKETTIPDRPVYLRRNLVENNLLPVGSYLYVTQPVGSDKLGFGGIIIVHTYEDDYCAFDLACPKEQTPSVRIGKPNELLICTCESCGEQYDLMYGLGTPLKGISKVPLKRYSAYIDPFDDQYIVVEP